MDKEYKIKIYTHYIIGWNQLDLGYFIYGGDIWFMPESLYYVRIYNQ